MNIDIIAFLFTLIGVTIAEIGDKSQLLIIAFSTKYKPYKVFLGIIIATILLSSTAVIIGNYITKFDSIQLWIQSIAAVSFILFGLWTLSNKEEHREEMKKSRFGPVLTVIFAFFIAELGDKTQLATMAFAAKFPDSPVGVFLGGTLGLILANTIGIGLGSIISRYISEKKLRLLSATVFVFFGLLGIYQVVAHILGISIYIAFSILIILLSIIIAIGLRMVKKSKQNYKNILNEVALDKQNEHEE